MANKILNIGKQTTNLLSNDNLIIYSDISMKSKYNTEAIYDTKLSKFKIEKNINVKAVQNALHNIFTWIPGERILNPEFGSKLYRYLYNGITEYNTEQIMAEIRKCISEWEPRVKLEQVKNISDVNDTENNTVHLEIIYSIPALNNKQYNYTYVYHRQ